MSLSPNINTHSLAVICKKHGVSRLLLFGSAIHGNFNATSDIDLLVEFLPGQEAGHFKLAALQLELEEAIGRKVDLKTPAELSRYFRDRVMQEAVIQYAA